MEAEMKTQALYGLYRDYLLPLKKTYSPQSNGIDYSPAPSWGEQHP